MTDTSWVEIDLAGLKHNVRTWRAMLAPRSIDSPAGAGLLDVVQPRLCGVVKADAYGLGAKELGLALDTVGVDVLAVYSPSQADELLQHPLTKPVLMLMPVREKPQTVRLHNALVEGMLHFSVDSPDQLLVVAGFGESCGCQVPVHLALDTGMSRGGLNVEQFNQVVRHIPKLRHVRLAGVWTHFAAADCDAKTTEQQYQRFRKTLASNYRYIPADAICHAASTNASLRHSKYHMDMTRVGLGLLGYSALTVSADDSINTHIDNLRPVMRWRSKLVHVRQYSKGASVGYNGTHRLSRDSFLGIVPVGYGDGYPLNLGNQAYVGVLRRRDGESQPRTILAPVVGRVNMDQIIIDLTPGNHGGAKGSKRAAGKAKQLDSPLAQVDDVVELVSPDNTMPHSLPNLARMADSSPYEMLCRISPRVPRVYIETQQRTATPTAQLSRQHSAA